MNNEIEAKFLSVNIALIRDKLKKAGFKLKNPEYMMRRKTFDFPASFGHKRWGRVRQESDKVTMTVKEIRGSGINDTFEIELIVNDFNTASAFFEICDIHATAFQENLREEWVRNGVYITIDTWPGLNPFTEIEGASVKIVQEVSEELGFDLANAIFGSIDLVYEKELGIPAETIIKLTEVTFTNPPNKRPA